MQTLQEELFSLPVTRYSREELFNGAIENATEDQITMEQLINSQDDGREEPNFQRADHVFKTQTSSGEPFWFHLQKRTVDLKDEETQLFYFRNLQPYMELREAQQTNRNKDLIVATSSHELRTPLNGILTMLDMLENSHDRRQNARFIRIARVSAKLMLSLVNDMLDFSTIMNGKFRKRIAKFNIRECIEEAADLLRFQIEEKGLRLGVNVQPSVPENLVSDRDRIRQLTLNLLSNAYKYTPGGEIEVSAETVIGEESRRFLQVNIRDTGIGISEAD